MNVQASVVHFLHHIITKRYKITMIDIHAEESIDEEVTCLGLGHQQENCAKPPTSPTSSSELIGVNDQVSRHAKYRILILYFST